MKMYQIVLIAFLGLCFTACDLTSITTSPNPNIVTGPWDVEMTMTFSDCNNKVRNETFRERWHIYHLGSGRIKVETEGSSTRFRVYEGEFTGSGIRLRTTRNDTTVKIGVNMEGQSAMEGTRHVEMNRRGCQATYHLHLNRSNGYTP